MELVEELSKKGTFGVLISRLCPMTLGHQKLIELLMQAFGDDYIVFLGSSNNKISMPDFFSHKERSTFAKIVFPNLRIIGLPDYGNNEEWFGALEEYLAVAGAQGREVVFVAGSFEDVEWFHQTGRNVFTIDRYSGEHTPRISGSQVRSALIERQTLEGLLDQRLIVPVQTLFDAKWPDFLKHRA